MRQFTLPNGIRCVLQHNACHQSITVNVTFRVGSRDEPTEYHGLTHFAEHMFFKGTKNRPKAQMISSEIDQYGGQINAVTDYDTTFYYIKINRQHLDVALDVLSDMLFHSLFESKEIKSEKEVVVEEIHMYKSNPQRHIDTITNETIYRGTTLEHDVGGDPKTVRAATREKFLAFLSHFYQPENTVISMVGNFPESESKMEKIVAKYFNHKFTYLPSKTLNKYKFPKKRELFPDFHSMQKEMRFRSEKFPNMKNTYLAVAFPAFSYKSDDYYTSLVMSAILSGGMSGRLFIEIREKRGMVYRITSDLDAFEDLGIFSVEAATSGGVKKISKVIDLILDELAKIKNGKVTNKDIKKAQEYLMGSELIRRESSSYLAETAAYDLVLFGRVINGDEFFEKVMQVTKNDVINLAKHMFHMNKMTICLISNETLNQKDILGKRKSI